LPESETTVNCSFATPILFGIHTDNSTESELWKPLQ